MRLFAFVAFSIVATHNITAFLSVFSLIRICSSAFQLSAILLAIHPHQSQTIVNFKFYPYDYFIRIAVWIAAIKG